VATIRTFTLIAPGVFSNEFSGAIANFGGATTDYQIISNTEADPVSGEVIFTVGAQYDLLADGISGPVALTGTAEYSRYNNLSGTIAFALRKSLTGTISLDGNVVTGDGTAFSTELTQGANLYVGGEARTIQSITSDTTLTLNSAFSVTGNGLSAEIDNTTVVGTTTAFDTELSVGDTVYAIIEGVRQGRTVAAITDASNLELSSGYTEALGAGTQASTDNLTVTGTTTAFDTELSVGNYIVDPGRAGSAVKVAAINAADEIVMESAFSGDFTAAELAKQTESASVVLTPPAGQGLSIEIGQGIRFPATHFSMTVFFNGSEVLNVQDASLDESDPLFVEPLVNDSNIAVRTGSTNYPMYIRAESLWDSAYTTAEGSDVRPCNGAGQALHVKERRLYTISDLIDYSAATSQFLYPNPYTQSRSRFRITATAAPVDLQGTVSSSGTTITGTSTNFLSALSIGDFLYSAHDGSVREIISISSDTELEVAEAFGTNIPALTMAKKAGYLEIGRGYDLRQLASIGSRFLVVYPTFLGRGYDGDTAALIPFNFTRYADIDTNQLEAATWGKNQGLIRIAVPGISDVAIQKAFIAYATARAYEFRGEVPSNYTSAAAAESFVVSSIGRSDFMSISFPSYGFISNPLGAGSRLVPLSGDIMGGESRQAVAVEGYHNPFAGVDATIDRVLNLPVEITPQDEAVLNVSGVQPLKILDGVVVVFGGRAPSRSPVFDFLHVRRTQSNYVRVFLEERLFLQQMFRPTQPEQVDAIVMILNNFARREYRKGVMSRYLSFSQAVLAQAEVGAQSVVTDANTQDAIVQIINGRVRLFFRWVPAGVLETLTIDAGPDILTAEYGSQLTAAGSL
jgi:hypothetical protein